MATSDWAAPETLTSALTTELNSLANTSFSAASAAITNGTGTRYPYLMLEVNLASLSPTAGAYVDIWIEYAADGSNYSDHAKALQTSALLATFGLDTTAATAQRLAPRIVPILPMSFKLALRNMAGVALAASANTLKYSRVTDESV